MAQQTDFYAQLGRKRAEELLDEYGTGFSEHPLSNRDITLSESQAQSWLYSLTWWDFWIADRLVGNGLSQQQFETFHECLLSSVCERVGRLEGPFGDASVDTDDDETSTNHEFEMYIFGKTRAALTDAWNQNGDWRKSFALCTVVSLRLMGIEIAETENYRDIFEWTLRLVQERTTAFAELLRASESKEQRPRREKMAPIDVHKWISDRPSDKEYEDSQEDGTLPGETWRAWAEKMPTREEIADAHIEDDELLRPSMIDAIQKKAWVDTVDQLLTDGWPDDIYHASSDEKEVEKSYQSSRRSSDVDRVIDGSVPGFSDSMKDIDRIEDEDLRAMARKQCLDQVAERINQNIHKHLDDYKREEWRESPAGRFASFLKFVGLLIVITLLAQSC